MKSKSSSRFWALTVLALGVVMTPVVSEADPLAVELTTDKGDYTRGEQTLVTLKVTNTSIFPVTVSFSNGQKYDFTARDAQGTPVWTWSTGKNFEPAGSQRVLAPGESLSFQENWAFTADGGQPVLDGAYTVSGTFLGNYLGKSGPKVGTQSVTLTTPDVLQVAFSTDKASYGRFEQATLTLTVTNTASYALPVQFNSAQLYDFSAKNSAGAVVWTWSNGKTFEPTPQEVLLGPGESLQFQANWTLVSNSGTAVPSGTYTVSGTFLGDYYGKVGTKSGEAAIQVRPLL